MTKNNITLKDILYWIIDNSDDTDAMEKINKTTFPFTERYAKYPKKTGKVFVEEPGKNIASVEDELKMWGDV